MATLYNSDLKPLESGDYTHYYDHATKLFLADNFRLAPKQSFLYYVSINVDISALQNLLGQLGQEGTSSQTLIEQYETGLLAKRVELPRFTVNTSTLNAYNRKNIVQKNLRYDPLSITFHDDAADTVLKFWNDFYTYYYRDSDYNQNLYTVPHKYEARLNDGWGFSPRNANLKPFLRNIQIFSLHNKRFTEYLLVNPIISSWRQSEHNSSESNALMEATMTVEYETVKYRTGFVNPVDVNGFAVLHYDNTPSPISNSVTNIYTDAGLLGALTEGSTDLARPDTTGSGSGLLGSILSAYRFYNNLKDTNFKDLGGLVLGQIGAQVLGGAINGAAQNVFFPTLSSTPGYGTSTATSGVLSPPASTQGYSPYSSPQPSGAVTVNNQAAAVVTGGSASFVNSILNNYTRGVATNSPKPANPESTANYQLRSVSDNISLDARSAQPATDEITSVVYDQVTGEELTRFQNVGNQAGGFDPTDPNKNAEFIVVSTDQSKGTLTRRQYTNGDVVLFNEDGSVNTIQRGFKSGSGNFNTNPPNTRDQAAAGQVINPTSVQYYTDPTTGITRVVNGGVSGLFRNTLSGAIGGITGLSVGSALYGGISDAFGGGIVGKTIGVGLGGSIGTGVGIGVNNLVQTGLNKILGTPTQTFNPATGQIQNAGAGLTGSGGYDSRNPSRNIVTYSDNGNGTTTVQTVNGGTGIVDNLTNSLQSFTGGVGNAISNWLGTPGINQDAAVLQPPAGTGFWTDSSGSPITTALGDSIYSGFTNSGPTNILNQSVVDNFGAVDMGPSYDQTFLSSYDNIHNWNFS
jgi:hypothetical protein